MIVLVFKFILPLLLGYALFVGITGRLNPLGFPEDETVQKSWFLGIVAGATVCIVFTLYIHVAYTVPATPFSTFLIPASTVAITLFALWIATSTTVKKFRHNLHGTIAQKPEVMQEISQQLSGKSSIQRKHATSSAKASDLQKDHRAEVSPAYLRNANVGHLNLQAQIARNDTVDIYLALDEVAGSICHEQDKRANIAEQGHHLKLISNASAGGTPRVTSKTLHLDDGPEAQPDSKLAKNLQTLQIAIAHEKAKRQDAEKQSATLKSLLMNAKLDMKRYNVARAKALSTANKSIAFARQTVDARGRLEQELELARTAMNTHKRTIADLQLALQKMNAGNAVIDESSPGDQSTLPLADQELHTSVKLPEKGDKLTSGLVKKVARSRSVTASNTPSKPGM